MKFDRVFNINEMTISQIMRLIDTYECLLTGIYNAAIDSTAPDHELRAYIKRRVREVAELED